jgi:nitrite reductase/ring-hydroxylating ferredoxin subunit
MVITAPMSHGAARQAWPLPSSTARPLIGSTFHFGKFHVPSGKATEAPCFIALKTFKTEVRDGQVFVDLDKPAPTAAAS